MAEALDRVASLDASAPPAERAAAWAALASAAAAGAAAGDADFVDAELAQAVIKTLPEYSDEGACCCSLCRCAFVIGAAALHCCSRCRNACMRGRRLLLLLTHSHTCARLAGWRCHRLPGGGAAAGGCRGEHRRLPQSAGGRRGQTREGQAAAARELSMQLQLILLLLPALDARFDLVA